MNSKFTVSLWFLLVLYATISFTVANGENACSSCHPNGECIVKSEGWAAPRHANVDRSLVVRIGPYGYVAEPKLDRCITEEYRLTGDVFDYICFWKPGKCEAVVPHYKLHNNDIMEHICQDCSSLCACDNAPPIYIKRGLILNIPLIVLMIIFTY